jgi:hypothetical protein
MEKFWMAVGIKDGHPHQGLFKQGSELECREWALKIMGQQHNLSAVALLELTDILQRPVAPVQWVKPQQPPLGYVPGT